MIMRAGLIALVVFSSALAQSAALPKRGTLDKERIREVVRRNVRSIFPCYERERPVFNLGDTITVRFTIASSGKVVSSEVVASKVGNPRLEACVAQKFHEWTFPKPDGDGIVVVLYPLGFRFAGAE
jgi:hypothetical protein